MTQFHLCRVARTSRSVALALDHGVVRHFHASVGAAASLQRSGHAVAELEVGVRHVRAERELEVRVGAGGGRAAWLGIVVTDRAATAAELPRPPGLTSTNGASTRTSRRAETGVRANPLATWRTFPARTGKPRRAWHRRGGTDRRRRSHRRSTWSLCVRSPTVVVFPSPAQTAGPLVQPSGMVWYGKCRFIQRYYRESL